MSKKPCFDCKNREEIPGECHINCKNPPNALIEIGSGGDERYEVAKTVVEASDKSGVRIAVVCLWTGCGVLPICFDENTVFACDNCNVDPKDKSDKEKLLTMFLGVPVLGKLEKIKPKNF